jgi:regulatory protein
MSAAKAITQIKPLSKDPNLRRIYVDKRAVVTLSASDVERLKLREGTLWTAHLEIAVRHEAEALEARRDAMRMLGRRDFSSAELIDRLVQRNHSPIAAERAVKELVEDQWIDDAKYAREVVHALTRRKPASKEYLKSMLARRKINSALAAKILHAGAGQSEAEAALTLARQQLSTMKQLPLHTASRRISGKLARRGFDGQTIADVLERIGLGVQLFLKDDEG